LYGEKQNEYVGNDMFAGMREMAFCLAKRAKTCLGWA
jgi:hypothetical protein